MVACEEAIAPRCHCDPVRPLRAGERMTESFQNGLFLLLLLLVVLAPVLLLVLDTQTLRLS